MGHGRVIQEFVRQVEEPSHVVVFTDPDHAGCLNTRKSTSSKLFYGPHMLRSTSTALGVIPLSSGESEFYGTSAVSMLKDQGVDISKNTYIDEAGLEVRIDASAGRDTAVQRGAKRFNSLLL